MLLTLLAGYGVAPFIGFKRHGSLPLAEPEALLIASPARLALAEPEPLNIATPEPLRIAEPENPFA